MTSARLAEPVADIGELAGGRVEDSNDDFACRYMFAFWRLVAQGVTTTKHLARPPAPVHPHDPEVRMVRLSQNKIPGQFGPAKPCRMDSGVAAVLGVPAGPVQRRGRRSLRSGPRVNKPPTDQHKYKIN